MPSFIKDITPFYGTGEKNKAGQSLDEFLDAYNPYKYKTPSCTTDAVVFSHNGVLRDSMEGLKVLLVKRSNHPCIGFWALPGGFIELDEDLDMTVRRELQEETGVGHIVMEQLGAYGNRDRDPRARVITTAYMALIDEKDVCVRAGDDAADALWCPVSLELAEEKLPQEQNISQNIPQNMLPEMSQIISQDRLQNMAERRYILHFLNEEKGLDTKAEVLHRFTCGLIREETFSVIERGIIAADHAAIIAQAMVTLKNRLS